MAVGDIPWHCRCTECPEWATRAALLWVGERVAAYVRLCPSPGCEAWAVGRLAEMRKGGERIEVRDGIDH